MSLRVLFMGTPRAAEPSLDALIASDHSVVGVVTSQDKPRGRRMKLSPTPIKERALKAGFEVLTVSTLKDDGVQDRLASFGADIFVVTAFGFILPSAVLRIPPLGCINVHFSLLPRWRGAAPIQWALMEGDEKTGVTIIRMDEGLDTGPSYSKSEESISQWDTAETLEARLAVRGAELLIEVLELIESNRIIPVPQDEEGATLAPKLRAEDARVVWTKPADRIAREVRAFNPRPGAWTTWREKRLKIWKVSVGGIDSQRAQGGLSGTSPGEIEVSGETLLVQTGTMPVAIEELQLEGKSRMTVSEFIHGHRPSTGEKVS